jgi:hypothetical protein
VIRRTRRQWQQIDANTPQFTEVRSTVTNEVGQLYGIDGQGRAHVRFPDDAPGVVDLIDPATLVAQS